MSPTQRDQSSHNDSPSEGRPDTSERLRSNADTENSAAHIAELVRRTTARLAAPGPSSVVNPDVTVAQESPVPAASVAAPLPKPIGSPPPPPARPRKPAPSRRTLAVGAAVLAVLVAGGVLLAHMTGSEAKKPAPTAQISAPAGYAVRLSDVVTDCAAHARGEVKTSFETLHCVKATRLLATGRISGRPALFVVSRIRMASAEAAASVKQVLDGSETGNLNDLLREGKTFPGAPAKMPVSGYTSVQNGTLVTVVEAGFTDGGPSSSTNAELRASAAQVAAMVGAQG